MTIEELATRVRETTGLDVLTVESLTTAISNCYADLTSRGYKLFKEAIYESFEQSNGMAVIPVPSNLRRSLYFRVQFDKGIAVATRLNIGNPRILNTVINNEFRTRLAPGEVVYYIKGSNIVIEWDTNRFQSIIKIMFGFYEKLSVPTDALNSESDLSKVVLDIRPEFADAVVLYCTYFFYQRTLKEDNRIATALNNYKYLVEDIVHEISYEDSYNECDSISEED